MRSGWDVTQKAAIEDDYIRARRRCLIETFVCCQTNNKNRKEVFSIYKKKETLFN